MNIYNERNNDISENLYSKESALKYNITVSIFRYLLELEKDEMLREILVKYFLLIIIIYYYYSFLERGLCYNKQKLCIIIFLFIY
jgi:hypothetical protein